MRPSKIARHFGTRSEEETFARLELEIKNKTTYQIAEEVGVTHQAVSFYLARYGHHLSRRQKRAKSEIEIGCEKCKTQPYAKRLCVTCYSRARKRGTLNLYPASKEIEIVCEKCKMQPYARGLCRSCYAKARKGGALNLYPLIKKPQSGIVCEQCQRKTQHYAKGLCRSCYVKARRGTMPTEEKLTVCEKCQRKTQPYARGLCRSCYDKARRGREENPEAKYGRRGPREIVAPAQTRQQSGTARSH